MKKFPVIVKIALTFSEISNPDTRHVPNDVKSFYTHNTHGFG